MRVWLVAAGENDDYCVYGVCSSYEKAKEAQVRLSVAGADEWNDPEAFEVDDVVDPEAHTFVVYLYELSGRHSVFVEVCVEPEVGLVGTGRDGDRTIRATGRTREEALERARAEARRLGIRYKEYIEGEG